MGIIHGRSGCGKSSLLKAGLLPRLASRVITIPVQAARERTESELLRAIQKKYRDQFENSTLTESIASLRRGQGLEDDQKVLLIINQFEQWLHATQQEKKGELFNALRQCDGGRVQCVLLVRSDFFWDSLSSFMKDIEVPIVEGHSDNENARQVDAFSGPHTRNVLIAFGQALGQVTGQRGKESTIQDKFLDQAIAGLSFDGLVLPVQLAMFINIMKDEVWTLETLSTVLGKEGLVFTFLDRTFSGGRAKPNHKQHKKAATAVLESLLPEIGSDIKREVARQRMLEASGYDRDIEKFYELLRILDNELRLITPSDPIPMDIEGREGNEWEPAQHYQLTHEFLVSDLRKWVTLEKARTRQGRTELLLADRSMIWNAKPENRHLPSVWEWGGIRLLTKKKDWTEPQRKMMRRAGRVHGLRGLGLAALIALITWGGYEALGSFQAGAIVDSLKTASTAEVPDIVKKLSGYYRWARRPLSDLLSSTKEQSSPHLHASLALLPVDPGQVEYLYNRMLNANPTELPVIREALSGHQWTLIERLWGVLENTQADRDQRFRAAWALAGYVADETEQQWVAASRFITDRLLASVNENPSSYPPLMEMLRPIRKQLLTSLATTFRDPQRPKTERYFATNILADYASDQPNLLADLLMDADPKAYAAFFPIAQGQAAKTLPLFQAEIARKLTFSWNDPPLDLSWTKPDASLSTKIESAQGMLAERFAFCQTMPLDEFLTTAEGLRPSGYRPTRFRPYANGKTHRVAAVWTRDGRHWRMAHGQSADEIQQADEQNRKAGFLPLDVAGYLATGGDEGKPTPRFATLWAQRTGPDDEAQMFVASSVAELTKLQEQLKNAGLVPLTLHAWGQADDKLSYSGVWHKTATGTSDTASSQNGLSEANLPGVVAQQSGSLTDVDLAAAPPPPSTKDRATSALQVAEAALKAKPDDLNARFGRATAHFQLGENQKAIDDLNAVIEKAPQFAFAYQYRAIAHARLGHKDQAKTDLGAVPEGRLHREHQALPGGHRGGGTE